MVQQWNVGILLFNEVEVLDFALGWCCFKSIY
jgi:hypothetical protein